jgi:hypothetical protein
MVSRLSVIGGRLELRGEGTFARDERWQLHEGGSACTAAADDAVSVVV